MHEYGTFMQGWDAAMATKTELNSMRRMLSASMPPVMPPQAAPLAAGAGARAGAGAGAVEKGSVAVESGAIAVRPVLQTTRKVQKVPPRRPSEPPPPGPREERPASSSSTTSTTSPRPQAGEAIVAREAIVAKVTELLGRGPGKIVTSSGFLRPPSHLQSLGLDPATITKLVAIYMPFFVTDECWHELNEGDQALHGVDYGGAAAM